MNIALLTRKTSVTKEATHITANSFAQELAKSAAVTLISGKTTKEHLKKIKSQDKKFNIIHNFSASPLFAIKTFLAKRTQKQAKTVHTLKSYSRSKLGSLKFARILNLVDAVTVPTQVMANNLIANGVKKRKVHVIHSHINTTKFIPLDKARLKSKYGYVNQKIVFYYGSTYYKKGLQNLIQASQNINAQIIIAPRDFPDQEFFTSIKNRPNIKVITEDINVVDYVNFADLVVLPYLDLTATEGNPSCLLEAMACKTPVVTTNLPELRELFQPAEDLLIAEPNNVESLTFQINRLLHNPTLAKTLTENAFKKIDRFDVKVITKQFINLYNSLLNKNQ